MSDHEIFEAKTPEGGTLPVTDTVLAGIASDPNLSEYFALALLKRPNLHLEVLEQLARNVAALKSRKVKIALASHPHTPRHISVPLARQFYTFELMKVALAAGVPPDVKIAVDDVLISRLKTVTMGERLTLARRASGRVAAELLLDMEADTPASETDGAKMKAAEKLVHENRVTQAALENPRLTEALVISSVLRPNASVAFLQALARHPKWSRQREIRVALLRTEHLSLARALEFSQEIPRSQLRDLLASSRLPVKIKGQLLREG